MRPDTTSPPAAPAPPAARDEAGLLAALPRWAVAGILVIIAAATVLVTGLIAGHAWQIGIEEEWTWPFYPNPSPWVMAMPSLVLGILLSAVAIFALVRGVNSRAGEAIALVLCLALALGLIVDLGNAGPAGAFEAVPVTAYPWISGYYGEAVRIDDMGAYLRHYPERISALKVNDPSGYGHLSDHPAGPVVFHWWVNRTMDRFPAMAQRFAPDDRTTHAMARRLAESDGLTGWPLTDGQFAGIWASALLFRLGYWLALLPLYLLVREFHGPRQAILAVALAAMIPALHLFGPYPDQFFPLFNVFAFYAWIMAFRRRNLLWAGLSAATVVLGLQWSMAMLAVGPMIGIATLLMLWREWAGRRSFRSSCGAAAPGCGSSAGEGARPTLPAGESSGGKSCGAAAPGCGSLAGEGACPTHRRSWLAPVIVWFAVFAVATLLPMMLFGYDGIRVWKICLAQHATFADVFPRSRWSWTLFNPVEFVVFTGVPAALLMLLAAAADAVRCGRFRWNAAPAVTVWSLLGVLAVLNLSGKNLGETARLWMMLMPFAAAAAAPALAALERRRWGAAPLVLALTLLQLAVFRLHLNVHSL